ncbi:MAG: hypothetical protein ACK5XP_09445 [Sphingobacteriia bacterium]
MEAHELYERLQAELPEMIARLRGEELEATTAAHQTRWADGYGWALELALEGEQLRLCVMEDQQVLFRLEGVGSGSLKLVENRLEPLTRNRIERFVEEVAGSAS